MRKLRDTVNKCLHKLQNITVKRLQRRQKSTSRRLSVITHTMLMKVTMSGKRLWLMFTGNLKRRSLTSSPMRKCTTNITLALMTK